jgi:Cysteine protease
VPRDPEQFAKFLYNSAKRLDPWEGEDYDGTSVLAGAKAMKQIGLLKEYRWAFTIDDVVDSILAKGPVVLGTYWRDGMYEAPNGVLRVEGEIVGGHCYTAVGYARKWASLDGEDGVIVQNSWGSSWGNSGLAAIKVTDLAQLLRQDGEACVPAVRSYGYYKP